MIGVAENHLGTGLLELTNFDSFHGAEGSDGHKGRQLDCPVSRLKSSSACAAVAVLVNECVYGNGTVGLSPENNWSVFPHSFWGE